MDEADVLGYVNAAAAVLQLPLSPARAQRVAEHLNRTVAMARLLEQAALLVDDEPAEIYRLARPGQIQPRERPDRPQPADRLDPPEPPKSDLGGSAAMAS